MPSRGRFGVDGGVAAGDGPGGVGDGDVEVLGHLVFVDELADLEADLVGAGEAALGDGGEGGGEELFGGGEQAVAFVGALVGQGGVAAGDALVEGGVGGGDVGGGLVVARSRLQRARCGRP